MNYIKISLGIFLALAASRFIPHPPNFTSLLALSFYVPALLGIRYIPALVLSFVITDLRNEIVVSYVGLVPNLFSEEKGVVAEGSLRDKKYFIADKILAKHDENYMPPEVSDALDKAN